MIETEC